MSWDLWQCNWRCTFTRTKFLRLEDWSPVEDDVKRKLREILILKWLVRWYFYEVHWFKPTIWLHLNILVAIWTSNLIFSCPLPTSFFLTPHLHSSEFLRTNVWCFFAPLTQGRTSISMWALFSVAVCFLELIRK